MAPSGITITADDYGLDPAVNRGIEQLAEAGMIDAVSIMAHQGADLTTLDRLAATGVRLGVHLVLVEEPPLTSNPELQPLMKSGRLPRTYRSLFAALFLRPSLARPLVAEALAQVERLMAAGVTLSFINSHQHVHLFPPLWRALLPLFESTGFDVRASAKVHLGIPKQFMVDAASRISLGGWPLRRCGRISPIGIGMAGRLNPAGAARAAAAARPLLRDGQQVELVTHPGLASPVLEARYPHWGYIWPTEWSLLASGEIRQVMAEVVANA